MRDAWACAVTAVVLGAGVALACGSCHGSSGGAPLNFGSDAGFGKSPEAGHAHEDTGARPHDAGAVSSGVDCPAAVASTVPADSPRILVLGPVYPDTLTFAQYLQGIFSADPAFKSPVVVGQTIDQPAEAGSLLQGKSLMYFFYNPSSRSTRLAQLGSPWTYVVLIDQTDVAITYPEFYFEGVRVLSCHARAVGATPVVLMTWGAAYGLNDTPLRGEIAYRVANGTGSVLSPAGFAWTAASGDAAYDGDHALFVAAATLYSTLTGRSAATTGYAPSDLSSAQASQLASTALQTVNTQATTVQYQFPYDGVVQMQTLPRGGDLWFISYGTSSEALWGSNMDAILPKAGFTAEWTQVGAPEGSPFCGSACLAAVTPDLQKQQYALFYNRDYEPGGDAGTTDAGTLRAIGSQKQMQAQVWDRHADDIPMDGVEAVEMMESMSFGTYYEARALGLAHTPYHLMFSKLKTMVPSVQLTSDGTHATSTVAYGQATMSVVSRTGIHTSTSGLDSDTALSSQLAEETIRQLSTLSVTGAFVADDPTARPTAH
jgi:hypothetical protein